jgi:hypothetical protein
MNYKLMELNYRNFSNKEIKDDERSIVVGVEIKNSLT